MGNSAPLLRFADRCQGEHSPNPLSQALARRQAAGLPVHDCTVSNPTTAGFSYPEAAIRSALALPDSLRYRPSPFGLTEARASVAGLYADRGVAIDPGQIVLTCSSSEAYSYLFRLFCNPGDQVLAPAPSYPLFAFLGTLADVELVPYPLEFDGRRWHLDLPALRQAITPRTRAILLVAPNNPTGNYLSAGQAAELAALARDTGLPLIADEVFADYPLQPQPDALLTLAGQTETLVFVLDGLSKTCALPQLKLSWIVAAGPEPARQASLERLEVMADTCLSVGTPVQLAAPALLAMRQNLQAQIRRRCRMNLEALRQGLAGLPAQVYPVEGGWYVPLQMPAERSDEEWALALIERHGLYAHPGYLFDFPAESHLVLSLLTPPAVWRDGLAALAAALA